jgi:hypothetical protein
MKDTSIPDVELGDEDDHTVASLICRHFRVWHNTSNMATEVVLSAGAERAGCLGWCTFVIAQAGQVTRCTEFRTKAAQARVPHNDVV